MRPPFHPQSKLARRSRRSEGRCARSHPMPLAQQTVREKPWALDSDAPSREGGAVEHEGFNLHASVRIAAEDDSGRERLCRYGARPPFSLERLRLLPGGRIAYRIKKLGAGRAKHRVMTPVELLARLAALVPPPRYPLVRYHGVQLVDAGPPRCSRSISATFGPAQPSERQGRVQLASANYDRVKVFYHAVLSYVGLREHRYAISSIRSLLPLKSTVSPARAPSISSKMGAIVEIPMISWPWHVNLAVETAMMK